MIDYKELYPGNIVMCPSFDKGPFKIKLVHVYGNKYKNGFAVVALNGNSYDVQCLEPIILASEHFFGTRIVSGGVIYISIPNNELLYWDENEKSLFTTSGLNTGIKYVHQWQNFYRAATGKELAISINNIIAPKIITAEHENLQYKHVPSFPVCESDAKKYQAMGRFMAILGINSYHRKLSVEGQFQRNQWDLFDTGICLRIENAVLGYTLHEWISGTPGVHNEYVLTEEEFKNLEKAYFGNFVPDKKYLRKLGVKI